jgi:hypothetical protein
MVFFFGLTLASEAWLIQKYDFQKGIWKALFKANVYSYLFLALVVVFFGPNPIRQNEWYRGYVVTLSPDTEISPQRLEYIHKFRASNLYHLGLTRSDAPPPFYRAKLEIDTIHQYGPLLETDRRYEKVIIILIDDTLDEPTITWSAREELRWLRKHVEYIIAANDARKGGNEKMYNKIISEWNHWYYGGDNYNHSVPRMYSYRRTNPFPVPFSVLEIS